MDTLAINFLSGRSGMRLLTNKDLKRLESAVRKVERMAAINQLRRQPVTGSWSSGGGLLFPTARRTIETSEGSVVGSYTHITLTREDCGKMIRWDGRAAVDGGDGNDRIFWLPADPKVGDAYFFFFTVAANVHLRMTALNHYIAGPYRELSDPPPGYVFTPRLKSGVYSHFFNAQMGQWQREEYLIFPWTDGLLSPVLQSFSIVYTGEVISTPINYLDADGDDLFNAHEGDLHLLVFGDLLSWSMFDFDEVNAADNNDEGRWWWSIEGPYG
jgi:hypothetical protein